MVEAALASLPEEGIREGKVSASFSAGCRAG
jgi:hypothetical protein